MRTLALILALVPGLVLAQQPSPPPAQPAPAAQPPKPANNPNQVYKWVDEQGVVHYTDKPPSEGAQPTRLPALQTYKGGTNPSLNRFDKRGGRSGGGAAPANIDIVTPSHDETFRDRTVPVAVMVTPQLKAGQKLVYLLDGVPVSEPTDQTSYAMTDVDRGTHTVGVTIIDEAGNEHGSAPPVTVHVKPPQVDNPSGKKPAKPAPKH
jgi:hypothetical protein